MAGQVLGYYSSRKQNLLAKFDETAAMVKDPARFKVDKNMNKS